MKNKKLKSKRNLFMNFTLMCLFLIGTFQFDESSFHWMWTGKTQIPIILGISSIILGIFWIIENRKLKKQVMHE